MSLATRIREAYYQRDVEALERAIAEIEDVKKTSAVSFTPTEVVVDAQPKAGSTQVPQKNP